MVLNTEHLGEIEFQKEDIIHFPKGIPGFEEEKEFIVVLTGDIDFPFTYLQSVKSNDLAFIVTDPFLFIENYDFELSDEDADFLSITNEEQIDDITVYTIVTIPEDVDQTTVNISAPIIINLKEKIGKQVILREYDEMKYPLFKKKSGE
ncbi:MAG: flagellar assembly protein FliW [Clostridiales bacterium]|nr:flagellar assembly protein FliW [Clostridiales bacterium]